MPKCKACGADAFETRLLDEFDVSGLLGAPFPVILEKAVKEQFCANCCQILGHIIPQPDQLSAVVAIVRSCDQNKMNGREIRFLRTTVGWKAKELAKKLSLSAEHLSRYENGRAAIGEVYERLLRALVCLAHIEKVPFIDLDLSTFTEMRILSARDSEEQTVIRLCLAIAEPQPVTRPMKWKRGLRSKAA